MNKKESVVAIADEAWEWLVATQPYYAVCAGVTPERILPVSEDQIDMDARTAAGLLARLRASYGERSDLGLAAVLEDALRAKVEQAEALWHMHPTAPYATSIINFIADRVLAPLCASENDAERCEALTSDLVARIKSIAERLRAQHGRRIAAPIPSLPGMLKTWRRLRRQLPRRVTPQGDNAAVLARELERAIDDVVAELDAGAELASEDVGLANLPGGEDIYRAVVRRVTTLEITPEQLHALGLEQCRELKEEMAQIRARLRGPLHEHEARAWIRRQAHLFSSSPDELAGRYRSVIRQALPLLGGLFRSLPQAPCDVSRLDPAAEAGMTYGYYLAPTPNEPAGLYYFNGSRLNERCQVFAVSLILHELMPGHHLHLARLSEDVNLHPVQRHVHGLAFTEGWAEYAAGLGFEMGMYENDWDLYGRRANERFHAQRLVVDTALNLGWWDLRRARNFMRANTLEGEPLIATETLRYATDIPGQALAYRTGFLAFQKARDAVRGVNLRDIHEAMLGDSSVPLTHMAKRVSSLALPDQS